MSTPQILGNFIQKNGQHRHRLFELAGICRRLIDAGVLVSAGIRPGAPPLSEAYYAVPSLLSPEDVEYGICDFVAFGFPYIRNTFAESVRAVIVEKPDGGADIGTAFLHRQRCLVTAAHCVRNMRHVEIQGWNPENARLQNIFVSADERCDLAVLRFCCDPLPNLPGFCLGEPEVLDDVMVMGYPPIPGFQTPLATETAQIAGYLQSLRGQVVAAGEATLDRQQYLLISARVKGGNSGGPVINRKGKVVGVVASSPAGARGELDPLAYGAAVPSNALQTLLDAISKGEPEVTELAFQLTNTGFQTAL